MAISIRDDITALTNEQKGFAAKSKLINRESIKTNYNHDFANDVIPDREAFDSPSHKVQADAARKERAAIKEGTKNYKLFTEQEIRRIYDSIDKVHPYDPVEATKYKENGRPSAEMLKKFRNTRLKAQMVMAYTMGLRASELAEMDKPQYAFKWKDIDLEDGTAKVTGKGNKTRRILIPPSALLHMREWHDIASKIDPKFKNSQFVFPSFDKHGVVIVDKPMSGGVFRGELKSLAEASGIEEIRLRPHVFRHSYATHLWMHGVGIESISKLLGHARLDTTRIYQHLTEEFMRLEAGPVIDILDPTGRTTTAPQAPKGIMGEGSSKAFNQFVNELDPEQKSRLQDVMHTYRDGVGDPDKGRRWLLNQLENLGHGENVLEVLDEEATRLRRGQIPGGAGGVASAAQQAREGVYRVLDESPLNNDMQAKIAADRLKASMPEPLGERAAIKAGEFGKNFSVKVTSKGAQQVLDIAKAENITIAQAYDRLAISIETTHFRLGNPEAREKFKKYINELFPQGIGRPGERVIFDPPGMPKGMIADAYEHHAIAQHLFDEGKLVDGDPVKTTEGRRTKLYELAKSLGAVNKDGSIKGSGDPLTSSYVGNQIKSLEKWGGEFWWRSFDVDEKTGQKIYIPRFNAAGTAPERVYPYLTPTVSGYAPSAAEAKKIPALHQIPAWARQIPSPEQAEFLKDMKEFRRLEEAIPKMGGNPDLAADREVLIEKRGVLIGKYNISPDGVPNRVPEFIPETVDSKIALQELNSSFDPDNVGETNRLASATATKQALTPDYDKIRTEGKRVRVQPRLIDQKAIDEQKRLSLKETAEKSALGKALGDLGKGTAKMLPFVVLGYAGYEILAGRNALAVGAEMLIPLPLEGARWVMMPSEAKAPGLFETEKARVRQFKKLQEEERQEGLKKAGQLRAAEIQRRVQSGEIPHPHMGAAGRAVHSAVAGVQELGEDVRSFFGIEDDSVGEVDVAGSPNFTQEEMAEYMSKDLMRAGLTPEGRQWDLEKKERRILHYGEDETSSFMNQ